MKKLYRILCTVAINIFQMDYVKLFLKLTLVSSLVILCIHQRLQYTTLQVDVNNVSSRISEGRDVRNALLTWSTEATISPNLQSVNDKRNFTNRKNVILLTICQKKSDDDKLTGNELASATWRQIEQVLVLVKSAVTLTSETLRFVLMTDTKELFDKIKSEIDRVLPATYRSKIELEHIDVFYPSSQRKLREHFRPCATAILFAPDALTHLDSVMYVDTDTFFMRPPEHLWKEFERFTEDQMVGMCPSLYYYDDVTMFPSYGETGLNSGVILMNLTRLKTFPGGWVNAVEKYYSEYETKISLADQDLLNILFSKHPSVVHDVSCDWNFRNSNCIKGKLCTDAQENGVSLIHGLTMGFYDDKFPQIKSIFDSWKNYTFQFPPKDLYYKIKDTLKEMEGKKTEDPCLRNYKSFRDFVLKRMGNTVL